MNEIDEALGAFKSYVAECDLDETLSCRCVLGEEYYETICKTLATAKEREAEITRGSGDVFKNMGLEQAPFPTLKGENDE
tara:strand:- start:347 stop:586 length:240 start_codon:yes stop_codon:yes gene_type:complete